jgi:RHS repeat-associated protein
VVLAQDPNALGQPTRAGGYAHTVTYHPNGGMSGFTYNNGIVHSLTQNTRDLPLQSKDKKAGQDAVLDDTYAYDANGNVLSIDDDSGLGGGTRQGILYDALDRLQYVDAPNQSWDSLTTYDALDNIRSNEVGSRLWTYAYNANNRLATLTKQDGTNPSTVATVTHDPNGNLTGNGIDTYTYDVVNRLQQVVGKESYVYDGHGRRVQIKRLSDNKIAYPFYSLDGKLITEDDNRSNLHSDFVYLNGSLVAKLTKPIGTSTWTFTYLHTDALGSPVVETSSTGDIIDSTKYKPYGEPSAYKQGPGFTGHVTDSLTGLGYMQQRYYDPIIGRFLSTDPVTTSSSGGNFNRYKYAANNPYKYTDPDGRREAADRFGDRFKHDAETGNLRIYKGFEGPAIAATAIMAAPLVALVGKELAIAALANPAAATTLTAELVSIAASGGALAPSPVTSVQTMGSGQLANLTRFEKSLPKGHTGVAVDALGNGVALTATVPGRVPGSEATYQKIVDSVGDTMSYLKTSRDPAGQVMHIKDKINNVELPKY